MTGRGISSLTSALPTTQSGTASLLSTLKHVSCSMGSKYWCKGWCFCAARRGGQRSSFFGFTTGDSCWWGWCLITMVLPWKLSPYCTLCICGCKQFSRTNSSLSVRKQVLLYLVPISSKGHLEERLSKVMGNTRAKWTPCQGSDQQFDLMSQELKVWM